MGIATYRADLYLDTEYKYPVCTECGTPWGMIESRWASICGCGKPARLRTLNFLNEIDSHLVPEVEF